MKYKGIELVEITVPQIFNPPKRMVVWDNDANKKELTVAAIIASVASPVLTLDDSDRAGWLYSHCAEIPEEPKPRRATQRELAKWLAQGNGEYTPDKSVHGYTYTTYQYYRCDGNVPVDDDGRVRKWDDTEWHEPTVDYLGIEEDE